MAETLEISSLPEIDRDTEIQTLFYLKGVEQVEIANKFGIHQTRVSQICQKVKDNESIKSKLIQAWEKNTP